MKKVFMENPHTGQLKEAPVGFSWTYLIFGSFVPMFRGDWKWAAITLLASLCTFGISQLVFPFLYNKLHIKDLVSAGFRVKSTTGISVKFIEQQLGFKLPELNQEV